MQPRYPVVLIVIDGWGVAAPSPHNAIFKSGAPHMQRLSQEYPHTLLEASGEHVGLPEGQMGNSEVGHLNIGAGRIVEQDLVRISKAARQDTLGQARVLKDLFAYCRTQGKALHVMGLLGPGGVHSHESHLFGLLRAAKQAGLSNVSVHHFLDGRDAPPKSALAFSDHAEQAIHRIGVGRVATVSGRYWSMDRDKRWDRTQRAYHMLTRLEGETAASAHEAIERAYARNETDEFVVPTVLAGAQPVREGDAILFYNFRPDRVRQIVRAFVDPGFTGFPTTALHPRVATLTQYDATFGALGVQVVFPPGLPEQTLGEVFAHQGLRQLRIAETEKYAHVTYFFSGGREQPFPGEDRLMIPSPKVATYDQKPDMSARELTDALLNRLETTPYDLVVMNFANPDMVGHTGMLEPAVAACRVTDECIGRIATFCQERGYLLAITADHGNAELMQDAQGRPQTAHTTNPVPFLLVHPDLRGGRLSTGGLSSVAPTLLHVLGLPSPPQMTAPSLWSEDAGAPKQPALRQTS